MDNTYKQIIEKAGLANNSEAIELADNFVQLYGAKNPTEDMIDRFIGMLGMFHPLHNYYQLHAEFCPSSRKNDPQFQRAAQRLGKYLTKMLKKTTVYGKFD